MALPARWARISLDVLTDRSGFFEQPPAPRGLGHPLAHLLFTWGVGMVPLIGLTIAGDAADPGTLALDLGTVLGIWLVFWTASVLEALLAHALLSLSVSRDTATGAVNLDLATTLRAYAYPSAIRYCLWWVPGLNVLLGLYGFLLQVEGLERFHDQPTTAPLVTALLAAVLTVPAAIATAVLLVDTLGAPLLEALS